MKKLVFILLLPVFCFAQKEMKDISQEEVEASLASIPVVDSQYEYSEVVVLDTLYNRNLLYRNAKLFFAELFKNPNEILQYDDKEEGKLIGKGSFQVAGSQTFLKTYSTESRNVNFTIEIFCKNGRYKYRIHQVICDFKSSSNAGNSKDRETGGILSLDQAFEKSQKGMTKKLDRKLFYYSVSGLKETADHIKASMSKKPASDIF